MQQSLGKEVSHARFLIIVHLWGEVTDIEELLIGLLGTPDKIFHNYTLLTLGVKLTIN